MTLQQCILENRAKARMGTEKNVIRLSAPSFELCNIPR